MFHELQVQIAVFLGWQVYSAVDGVSFKKAMSQRSL
jgi:hypothetical protein